MLYARPVYITFRVSDFRGIKSAELTDLARVNLLTGLNDAGKTTLLEALFLHASGPLAGGTAMSVLRPTRGQGLIVNGASGEATSVWESLFRNLDTSRAIRLAATTTKGDYSLELSADPGASSLSFAPTGTSVNRQGPASALIVSEQRGKNPPTRYVQSLNVSVRADASGESQTISVVSNLNPPVSEPFIRGTIVSGAVAPSLAEGYSELRRRQGNLNVLDAMQMVDDRISGLEVLVSEGQPQLHVDLGEGVLLPIQLLGDGPVSVAKYLIALAQAKDGILLIDEIGSGLHHTLYEQLWQVLFRAAERLNVQIFATSHSDEMLRAARSSLIKRPSELRIYRISRQRSDSDTRVTSYGDSKLSAAIEMNAELR